MSALRPLRVGLLLDSATVPYWLAEPLRQAQRLNAVEVCVAIIRVPEAPATASRPAQWWQNRHRLLTAAVMKWDARRAGVQEPAATPMSELAPAADLLVVTPLTTRFTDTISDADVARIRAYDLDVMLREGFRIIKGGILSVARHGVIAFHHGDNRVNRGGPTGVWEVLRGEEVSA